MKAFGKARSGRLRFHSFELDLDTGELQKNGRRIRLQDQPARLLALLASRPGELVTRSEIQKALWEDDRIVEFDTAVNTAIKKVREALDDDPENPKLVETLPRKGYRFIAVVEGTAALVEEVVLPVPTESSAVAVMDPPEAVAESVALEIPQPAPATPTIMEPAPRTARPYWVLIAFLLGLAIAGIPAIRNLNPPAPPVSPQMHLEVMTPPTADPSSLAISPDGLKIAFVAISEGRSQLRLRSLETWTEQSLAGTDGALFPFWSPNSQSIGFFADGYLKRVDIDGGLPRTLADAPTGRGGDWNLENIILYTPTTGSPIYQISAMGDTPGTELTQVGASGGSHRHPRFLPDGRHFLYLGEERSIYVGDLRGTDKPKRLVPQVDVAGDYVDKHLLFVKQGTLFAQSFDPDSWTLSGEPFRITDQVHVDAAMSLAALSVSDTGSMIYRTGSGGSQRQFVWYDRNGKELSRVGEPDGSGVLGPALSSDGRHIAMYRTVDGNSDIWRMELESGIRDRFTMDEYPDLNPVWSPDRRRIAFSSNRTNTYDLYVQAISGTETKLLLQTSDPKSASSWSPDGRHLLYRSGSQDGNYDIWALPFDDNGNPGKAFAVVATKAEEREAEFSPNGKWIAYQSTASGRPEVYIQPFPAVADSIRLPVSTNGGAQPRWGKDSELFYIALDGQLMAVPIQYTNNGREVEADPPKALFATSVGGAVHSNDRQQYVVSPDGQSFLMNTLTETSSPITVILNWKGKS
jgi:Tol biopolymer transport system component/DNA-binding winged helix-turn-helix (wHTH) protein